MRRFQLHRAEDKTGISGTGVIAEGVEFTDGTCAMRWLTQVRSTGFYTTIGELEAIHGHGGATLVVYLDSRTFPVSRPADLETKVTCGSSSE